MFCFIFFLLYKFGYIVKVFGNTTFIHPSVEDYLIGENMNKDTFLDYSIQESSTTQETSPVTTTTTTTTSTTTTSTTTPRSKDPSFKLSQFLVTISPEEIYYLVQDSHALNLTIQSQIHFMYGEHRPDKFEYVGFNLLKYFYSLIKPIEPPITTSDPYAGSTVPTLPPLEDYLHEISEKPKIPRIIKTPKTEKPIFDAVGEDYPSLSFTTLKPVTEKTLPVKQPPNKSELNQSNNINNIKLRQQLGRQGTQNLFTYKPDQTQASQANQQQTQTSSIKLPDPKLNQDHLSTSRIQQSAQYLSTPKQQEKYLKTLPEQQVTQLTTTKHIALKEGIDYIIDPAYADLEAFTGSTGSVKLSNVTSTLSVTDAPLPSTVHPFVQQIKNEMVEKKQGYFTAFVQQFCSIISDKETRHSKELYKALATVMLNMKKEGRLKQLGSKFERSTSSMLALLVVYNPESIKNYAGLAYNAIDSLIIFPQDVRTLFNNMDELYTFDEGEQLLNTLAEVYEYPTNNKTALDVMNNAVEKIFHPYFRLDEGSPKKQNIINSINTVMDNRNLGNRRNFGDSNDGLFERSHKKRNSNTFVNNRIRRKNEKNVNKEINEVIIKELIQNVKEMEAIKKYETHIVLTTKHYTSHGESSYFNRRSNFDKVKAKRNRFQIKPNLSVNKKQDEHREIELKDEISINKVGNSKTKTNKQSKKNIHLGMDIETDRDYDMTSESESKKHRKRRIKMDKHMKHRIRQHLKHRHSKLYKMLKKRHERNKRRRINKDEGGKRFNVVKKPPSDVKTRAEDNERPEYVNQQIPNIGKYRLSLRKRPNQKRKPGMNKRPYRIIRRTPGVTIRPPGSNRRSATDTTTPPDVNKPPSMYLTPRYEYNSRRFNENTNLTRRSNAKPISTELSYSNEEKDIKFYIQDAMRHPIDLKSKIQQNSLIFDKVQNGRRQMAPVDYLKEESNYSDDEGTIKKNIYKVFSQTI